MEFAEFLAPFDAGTFRSQYYGRQPLHLRRNGAGTGLLPWRRFNEVLALTPYWNEESLKVYFKSRAALRENYCDTADVRPGTLAPVNPAKLKALTALGASLVANHLHRVCPEVGAVVAMLEREFSARAFANVYCSFTGVQAFQTHFDLHDVFAVQAEGEKTWRVYESRADAPVNPVPPGDGMGEVADRVAWQAAVRGAHATRRRPVPAARAVPRRAHGRSRLAARDLRRRAGDGPRRVQAARERAREGKRFPRLPAGRARGFRARRPAREARRPHPRRHDFAGLRDRRAEPPARPRAAACLVRTCRRSTRPPGTPSRGAREVLRRDAGFAVAFEGGEIPVGAT